MLHARRIVTNRLRPDCMVTGATPAMIHEPVGKPLPRGSRVTFRRPGKGLERRADDRAALGVEQAVDPDQAINRLPDAQVSTLVRAVRLSERRLGVDLVFEVLRHAEELAGVHRLGRLQQGPLGLADLGGADRLSEGSRQLVQRAAVLGAYIENCEARWLGGEVVDLSDYLAAINAQRRVLATIGLDRRARNVTPAGGRESLVANSVTSWPASRRPVTSSATISSVPP